MPKETFTPEEERHINQLSDQINVTSRTQNGAVWVNLTMPPYPQDLGAVPVPTQQTSVVTTAATQDEALEQAKVQINDQIDNVERQIEEWLTAYRHQLGFYRLALAKATKALEREPGK